MEKPLVSVVTITRNRGPLLKRCISSVLSQTYENIEHIVVDGASDDNTDEVVASFHDSRLHFIKLDTNWPVTPTMNYGISLAKGKYLTFLDSDDEYCPEKIEKQVALIETLPEDYGMVYCWMRYFDTKTGKMYRIHKPELRGMIRDEVIEKPTTSVTGLPSLLFRKEAYLAFGGEKSSDEIGADSDWEMCARFCQDWKVDFVPEVLVNVYVNHGFIQQTNPAYYSEYWKRRIKLSQYMLNEFKDNFKRCPRKQCAHYIRMSVFAFRAHEYKDSIRYALIYLRILIFGK